MLHIYHIKRFLHVSMQTVCICASFSPFPTDVLSHIHSSMQKKQWVNEGLRGKLGQQTYLCDSALFGVCRVPSLPYKSGCSFQMINSLKRVFQLFFWKLSCIFWVAFAWSSLSASRGTCLSFRFEGCAHAWARVREYNATQISNAGHVHFGVAELFAKWRDLRHKNKSVYLCEYKHSTTVSAYR